MVPDSSDETNHLRAAPRFKEFIMTPNDYCRVEDAVVSLLKAVGEDPLREGLRDTPARVARMYDELLSGYGQDPEKMMTTFVDDTCDEMVVLTDIPFSSLCEHHLLPFSGTATVAYLPDKRIIGLSKLARVVDVFAKRLQVQERMTVQITDALMRHLQPKGAACVLRSVHSCMTLRGVQKQGAAMITSSLQGAFKSDATTRAEFMNLIHGR